MATTVSFSVRAALKNITLMNLLNDDFDDEIIAGTTVKRDRRHGKNLGSAEMEMKDETTFKHTKEADCHFVRRFAPVCIADEQSEAPHTFVSGYSKALRFRTL
jgi:hypothetical protein